VLYTCTDGELGGSDDSYAVSRTTRDVVKMSHDDSPAAESFHTPDGLTISVVRGSITDQKVRIIIVITRMVQLPATAAIEYVAACLPGVTFSPGVFWPGVFCPGVFCLGGLLPGGLFPRGSFAQGHFWPGGGDFCPGMLLSGGLLPGGTFVPGACAHSPKFNAYTHRLGFLCLAS